MTLENAYELNSTLPNPGRASERLIRCHEVEAVDSLSREYGLAKQWEIKPGTIFESAF